MHYNYSVDKQNSWDSNKGKVTKNKGFKNLAKVLVSSIVLATSFVGVEAGIEPQIAEAATTYTVAATTLNVRSGAGANYKVIGTVKKNAKLTVQGTSGSWYKIKFNGKTGYVSKSYVKASGSTASSNTTTKPSTSVAVAGDYTYTATANVNVRSTNNTSGKILGVAKKNEKLTVTAKMGNGWYKVNYKGKAGYVSGSYVKATKKATTTSNISISAVDTKSYTYTTTASLNMRDKNGTSGKIILVIPENTKLTIQGKAANGWYKVKYNNKTGYVSGSYVKVAKINNNNSNISKERADKVYNATLKVLSKDGYTTVDFTNKTATRNGKKMTIEVVETKANFKEGLVREKISNVQSHTLYSFKFDDNNKLTLIEPATLKVIYSE